MSDRAKGPRSFRRETVRGKPLYTAGPIAPWHAEIKIVPLELEREIQFEINVTWTGPPAYGFPPSSAPVQASDVYVCGDLELARAIAIAAGEDLARLEVPDLRGHASRFKSLRGIG